MAIGMYLAQILAHGDVAVDKASNDRYWTNFAKSGDPNAPGLPVWKTWNSGEEPYLEFSQNGAVIPQKSFSPPFCHLAARRLQENLGAH